MVVGETRWIVKGCERLQIPEWRLSDGPVGVRGRDTGPGLLQPERGSVGPPVTQQAGIKARRESTISCSSTTGSALCQ